MALAGDAIVSTIRVRLKGVASLSGKVIFPTKKTGISPTSPFDRLGKLAKI